MNFRWIGPQSRPSRRRVVNDRGQGLDCTLRGNQAKIHLDNLQANLKSFESLACALQNEIFHVEILQKLKLLIEEEVRRPNSRISIVNVGNWFPGLLLQFKSRSFELKSHEIHHFKAKAMSFLGNKGLLLTSIKIFV